MLTNGLLLIILANVFVGVAGVFGAYFSLRFLSKTQERILLAVAFAAGAMICASFLELLPEALKSATLNSISVSSVLLFVILGFILFYLLERTWLVYHCHEENCTEHSSTYIVMLGDAVHNSLDGLAIAASFLSSPVVGMMTTLAILTHEIPQEVGDFGVLLHAGFSKTKALLFNLATAVTGILGGVFGFYFFQRSSGAIPLLMAATAGGFIYIGAADLLPQTHQHAARHLMIKRSAAFLFGIFLFWILGLLIQE